MSVYNRNIVILIILLFLVSCSTPNETIQIELEGYNNSSNLGLLDDSLFIAVGSEEDHIDKIIEYNIKTKTEKLVYESDGHFQRINDLMVNNNHMIWVESTNYGKYARVLLFDRDTQKTKVIYEGNPDIIDLVAPYLYSKYVSWIELDDEGNPSVVTLYDIEKDSYKIISKVNDHNFYNNFVTINENRIYWSDIIDNENYFISYDINSDKIDKLQARFGTPGYVDSLDDYMFAMEFSNHYDWTTNKLTYTNLSGSDYKVIMNEWVYDFSVFKESIVYIENENGKVIKYNIKDNQSEVIETDLEIVEIIQASNDLNYLILKSNNDTKGKIEIELVPMN